MILYDANNKKMLGNWFDPYSIMHLCAYRELQHIGHWPEWFMAQMEKEEVIIHQSWSLAIDAKMVKAWVNYRLEGITEKE